MQWSRGAHWSATLLKSSPLVARSGRAYSATAVAALPRCSRYDKAILVYAYACTVGSRPRHACCAPGSLQGLPCIHAAQLAGGRLHGRRRGRSPGNTALRSRQTPSRGGPSARAGAGCGGVGAGMWLHPPARMLPRHGMRAQGLPTAQVRQAGPWLRGAPPVTCVPSGTLAAAAPPALPARNAPSFSFTCFSSGCKRHRSRKASAAGVLDRRCRPVARHSGTPRPAGNMCMPW